MPSNKTILVGIDYTKSSENAVNYAIKLAERSRSSIMLFHVYETPMAHTYSGVYFVSFNDIERYNKKRLDIYRDKLLFAHPKVSIKTFTSFTSFKQGVKDLLKQHKIDLVVLGMASKTKFSKFLYGSTGVDVAGKVNCPVIIVPEHYTKHRFGTNTVCVDNEKYLKSSLLKKVKDVAKLYNLKNEFLHVKTPNEFLVATGGKVKKQDRKLHVNTVEADNFISGINKYAKTEGSDLITVISHSHSLLYNLFSETNTKAIAYASKRPVMAIHE